MMQSNYEVTQLRPLNKKKTVVFLDGKESFCLYNSELRKYGIEEQAEVSYEQYARLLESVLLPRAKERALHLITVSQKTSQEIYDRLRQGYYPEDICDKTVHFLQEYGYLDDFEYARSYTASYIKTKSLWKIKMELCRKGIGEDIIKRVFEETETDETEGIYRWLEKKAPNFAQMDIKNQRRVYSSLLYRGYSYEQIHSVVDNYINNM